MPDTSTNDATKTAALAVSLAIQDDEWAKLDSLLGPDFTYTGDGMHFTRDQYIGFMQDMKDAFADMKMEFTHVLVDGEYVTINFISRAKNVGKFMGAPATKKDLAVHGTLIRQMRNGRAIQEWQTTDLMGVMTQMGFGALFGYAVAVGLFKMKTKLPVRRNL
jgi:predicted ester cyclase